MKQFTVRIIGSDSVFTVNQGESVLDAALRQGIMLPYSCKNGTCRSCKCRIETGAVHYPFRPPLALSRAEIADGQALLCQAEPTEDMVIHAREIAALKDLQIRKVPARVIEKTLLAHDVMRLVIKLPSAQRLQFLAGQYIDILLPDGIRRAFSIASPPQREDEIELHIRHVERGGFTGWVFDELKEREILRIEGPLGTFFIRHDTEDRPMILMGGGTGIAPLKSMIEDLIEHDSQRPLHLFWGVRTQDELYMRDQARQWADQYRHIQFTSALSEPVAGTGADSFEGFVHEAVLDQYPDLSPYDIYMSGPPLMIDSAREAFLAHAADKRRIFFDSFEFGLDVPIKVLARPH